MSSSTIVDALHAVFGVVRFVAIIWYVDILSRSGQLGSKDPAIEHVRIKNVPVSHCAQGRNYIG